MINNLKVFATVKVNATVFSYCVRTEVAMATVTVSEKGQVVIPAEIRRQLGIMPGCQLDFCYFCSLRGMM